jgi:caffeoyl-CoA O-methyltransferase
MSSRTLNMSERVHAYLLGTTSREPEILRRLRAETGPMEFSGMQISPEQGELMAFLVRLLGVRRYLEIGTFTGYSALAVALALPEDGRVTACDVSEDWTTVARRFWREAGVGHKIDLRLAPAIETLDRLLADGAAGSYDFIFIDADKPNYDGYYERALKLIRPGGLIGVDNVLWGGSVADPDNNTESTQAIRALNVKMQADPRIDYSLLPIGDGLALARRR